MTAPKMNPKVKAMWIKALRSGEYKQGKGQLRSVENNFCCLGVLCNIHAQTYPTYAKTQKSVSVYDGAVNIPSDNVLYWAGLGEYEKGDFYQKSIVIDKTGDSIVGHLWKRNDGTSYRKHTFSEIADFIEEHF
jgi:hypothetical protein